MAVFQETTGNSPKKPITFPHMVNNSRPISVTSSPSARVVDNSGESERSEFNCDGTSKGNDSKQVGSPDPLPTKSEALVTIGTGFYTFNGTGNFKAHGSSSEDGEEDVATDDEHLFEGPV
jgi:hypothetical protein